MLPNNCVNLRGYAYHDKKSGKYYAVCVDLDLIDEGSSFNEVMGKMKENIILYVGTEIVYNKRAGINEFPYRKSPLNIMLRYYLLSVVYRVSFIVKIIKDKYKKCNGVFDINRQVIHFNPV